MAKLFYKDKPIIGLDIGTTGMRLMAIDQKKWHILGYGSINMTPTKVRESLEGDGAYLTAQLKRLLTKEVVGSLPSNHVAIGIPTSRTYSRTFTLPAKLEKTLDDAVRTEADQYIPIPSNTLYIDYEIIERDKQTLTILMSATSQAVIDSILNVVTSAGLRPVLIEPSIHASTRLLMRTEEGYLPTIIVDVGPTGTDIAILNRGSIRVTGGTTVGGSTLTLAIAKKLDITLENAHQLKVLNGLNAGPRQQKLAAALTPSLDRVSIEVEKIMRYYQERIEDVKFEQLLITGSGSDLPGIGEYFTDRLVLPARVANPWQQLNFGTLAEPIKQFRPRFVAAAGLAGISPVEVRR